MDNMIECKKDSLRQVQSGDVRIGFTFQHADIPEFLLRDSMGKRYYVVFIDADHYDDSNGVVKESLTTEQTEGERLRTIAAIHCNDINFQEYARQSGWSEGTVNENARFFIYDTCNIKSRSELATNKNAQAAFHVLLEDFRRWKTSQDYADNLSRL